MDNKTYFDITKSEGAPTPAELAKALDDANKTIQDLLTCLTDLENEAYELNEDLLRYFHLYGPLPDETAE